MSEDFSFLTEVSRKLTEDFAFLTEVLEKLTEAIFEKSKPYGSVVQTELQLVRTDFLISRKLSESKRKMYEPFLDPKNKLFHKHFLLFST